jgi:hypothetical protein
VFLLVLVMELAVNRIDHEHEHDYEEEHKVASQTGGGGVKDFA